MVASMKRSYSDTEDDVFSEADGLGSPSQSCQISDRKKRRGIIEKRRRDRINNSLAELRRLVPTAFEKQGSAKLEKAEILQMTVDHLKHLHSKAYNYHDPHSLSMDYRVIGFRECAAEVARYMVTAEGMDIQDPLRLRMMSHLQCYSAQREAACKLQQTAGSASWNLQASGLNSQYNTNTGSIGPMSLQHTQSDSNLAMSMSSHMPHVAAPHCSSTLTTVSCHDPRSTLSQNNNNEMTNLNLRLPTTGGSVTPQMSGTVSSTNISPHVPLLPTLPHGAGQVNTQLPGYSMPMLSPNGTHSNYSMANSMSSISQQHAANTAKPYRPWGGPEVAY